jgi:hypothetical protein
MAQIARQTGATLHVYHHPGRAARRVVLRDTRNDRGAQFEAAQLEDDETLRVTGHHTGSGVSEFFGDAITSYDWAYVIAPDRVGTLFNLLGGQTGDDVLNLLATYHTAGSASGYLQWGVARRPARSRSPAVRDEAADLIAFCREAVQDPRACLHLLRPRGCWEG